MRQGLCRHPVRLSATSDFVPVVKRWGPGMRQGLCSHLAQLSATSDFVPRCEALGNPQASGVMLPLGPLVGHF